MMKANDLRKKTPTELKKELLSITRELFNLRMQKGVGQTIRPDAFKKARREIARIKTILNEMVRAATNSNQKA